MKFVLLLFTLLMTSSLLQVFGQARVNRQKLSFDTTSGTLSKATGWAYNSTLGEWIDYENVISDDRDYKDKWKNLTEYMMSRKSQNFIKIQTKSVTYKESKYYVLVVDKWSGRYQYPDIQEDWYKFKQTIGYIYTEQEYKKLHNIDNLIVLSTKYMVISYDETKFLDLIQTEISKEEDRYGSYSFAVMKSKEGTIRFYLPESFVSYDFEKKYFETDFDSFSSIIIR